MQYLVPAKPVSKPAIAGPRLPDAGPWSRVVHRVIFETGCPEVATVVRILENADRLSLDASSYESKYHIVSAVLARYYPVGLSADESVHKK